MSPSTATRFDLTDAEQRNVTFTVRDRQGRVHELVVAPPCMAQLLAVIRLEPEDPETETPLQALGRDHCSTLILCLPPYPRAWWERLPWYWRRWKVSRFVERLSYPKLALLINNLLALAQGVPVDVLEKMAETAPTRTPSEREKAINEVIAAVATEMKMRPQEVAELPAPELATLAEKVFTRLEREDELRELLAGSRRG